MWVAGNNATAKQTASDIARQFGFVRVLDAGDIKTSKLLEAVGCLWIVSVGALFVVSVLLKHELLGLILAMYDARILYRSML